MEERRERGERWEREGGFGGEGVGNVHLGCEKINRGRG